MTAKVVPPAELERVLEARLATARARRMARRRTEASRSRRRIGLRPLALAVGGILALTATAVFADGGNLDVQVADRTGYEVQTTTDGAIVEYIGDDNMTFGSAGTGTFGTFLQTQDNPSEEGYNTDGDTEFDTGSSPTFNHAMLLSDIPTVTCESLDGAETTTGLCWELFADINDSNANDPAAAQIQLTDLEIWLTADAEITGYDQGGTGFGGDADRVYDFDGTILINDVNQGSGRGDLRYLIPIDSIAIPGDCSFGNSACETYFVVYTEWGDPGGGDYRSDSGFEEWKVKTYPFVEVTKTATPSFTRTFTWDIDKAVDPAAWNLFDGDTGTSDYTIDLTKSAGVDSDWAVSGTITIDNTSELDAVITDVDDVISGGTVADVDCGVTFPHELEVGDSLVCDYSADLTDGTDRENTATVTLEEGTVFEGTADVDFGDPTTVVDGTVNVSDTVAGSFGPFSASDTIEYSSTFDCDDVTFTDGHGSYTVDNTATIVETGQDSSASVAVDCYQLDVTKDADESFGRTYEWSIAKSADQTAVELMPGQQLLVNYSVTVDVIGQTEDGFHVEGDITVTNPNPDRDADLTGVTDAISDFGAATVDCPSLTVLAGDSLTCSYEADLPDDTTRTNTATATQQNYDFDSAGIGTESGTTDYSGTASIDFTGATVAETDECIDVNDTIAGSLGTVCVGVDTLPKTFTYSEFVGPYSEAECGEHDVPNTADFLTNDTGATGESSWNVHVTVPCPQGCTLTQGYWKTHSEFGPAPEDLNWENLPGGLGADTEFFLSGQTWYEVFWTAPRKGNAYYILAHQYEAAVLNILNGASSTTEVDAAIAWAEAFFGSHAPTDQLSKAERAAVIQNAGILGSYNEGDIGPGHCTEDSLSSAAP
jgi:hypothetical protein